MTPPGGLSDQRLSVGIEMVQKGLEARSQQAFVPLTPERDRQLDVLNALWLEEGARESPLTLRLGAPVRLGHGQISVVGHLAIPAEVLSWHERGDLLVADVTVEVASVDWGGRSSDVVERRIRILRKSPVVGEIVIPWPFEVRRRRHTFVAGLRDHLGGQGFAAVAQISPRDPPQLPATEAVVTAELP